MEILKQPKNRLLSVVSVIFGWCVLSISIFMNKEYVTKIKIGPVEVYRISDTRVSLDSVVYSWLQGDSAETIADNFPALTLEEVYGAIAFYLANRETVDEYLRQAEAHAEELKQQWRSSNSTLYRKLLTIKEDRKKRVA
jgi:uncharacterized protein (DUF433 family)